MSVYEYSDIPFSGMDKEIIVVQPAPLAGMTKEAFLEQGLFNTAFCEAVFGRSLVHVSTLFCMDGGEPISSVPCRGKLSIKSTTEPDPHFPAQWIHEELRKKGWLKIQCRNNSCGLAIGLQVTVPEFQDLLLHLMIKQMNPSVPTCNFTDCSQRSLEHYWGQKVAEELRELGVVSVALDSLWGVCPENVKEHKIVIGHCHLGFMLMPGMRTLTHGYDGFDQWVKFLWGKFYQHLMRWQEGSKPAILGPKPVRRTR